MIKLLWIHFQSCACDACHKDCTCIWIKNNLLHMIIRIQLPRYYCVALKKGIIATCVLDLNGPRTFSCILAQLYMDLPRIHHKTHVSLLPPPHSTQ